MELDGQGRRVCDDVQELFKRAGGGGGPGSTGMQRHVCSHSSGSSCFRCAVQRQQQRQQAQRQRSRVGVP
jgi:hypothetical protein